jgi:hypothetical protein
MMVYVMLKTKSYGVILVVALSAIVGTGIVLAEDISICIAPATLNLNAGVQECDDVTVHTNIDKDLVDCSSLKLNDLTVAYWTKADNRGNLVVKFDRTTVKEIVAVGEEEVTLTLTGETTDGEVFTGSDIIRVIDEGQ